MHVAFRHSLSISPMQVLSYWNPPSLALPPLTMGLFDSVTGSSESPSGAAHSAHGANDIPAPRPDSAVNAPPPDQHKRVIDFVRVRSVSLPNGLCTC
jgi:hypothetical protein